MPSIPRAGKTTTAFDFDSALKARLEEFAAERGSTLTRELHAAVRRHLDSPQLPLDVDDLDPRQIQAELDGLEHRRDALRVLLRAALARYPNGSRKRAEKKS